MVLMVTEQTEWLAEEDQFWEGLSLKRMPSTNFCALYEAWFDTVSRRHLTKVGISAQGISGEAARETMNQLQNIEQEITSLRGQMKKESQFNHKLEINKKLQKLKCEKANIIEQGSGEI